MHAYPVCSGVHGNLPAQTQTIIQSSPVDLDTTGTHRAVSLPGIASAFVCGRRPYISTVTARPKEQQKGSLAKSGSVPFAVTGAKTADRPRGRVTQNRCVVASDPLECLCEIYRWRSPNKGHELTKATGYVPA